MISGSIEYVSINGVRFPVEAEHEKQKTERNFPILSIGSFSCAFAFESNIDELIWDSFTRGESAYWNTVYNAIKSVNKINNTTRRGRQCR